MKFKQNGDLEWGRSIIKKDTRPSYNVFLKNDELHVIFNSGEDLQILNDGRTKASKRMFESTALYDFTYATEGTEYIYKIQNNKDKTYYLPNYGTYFDGKFIMINDSKTSRKIMSLE